MLEIILDYSGNFIQWNAIQLIPILKNIENLIYPWPEMRIGSQKMPHKILHFLTNFTFTIFDISVDYAQLALLLERMKPIVEYIEHAT